MYNVISDFNLSEINFQGEDIKSVIDSDEKYEEN